MAISCTSAASGTAEPASGTLDVAIVAPCPIATGITGITVGDVNGFVTGGAHCSTDGFDDEGTFDDKGAFDDEGAFDDVGRFLVRCSKASSAACISSSSRSSSSPSVWSTCHSAGLVPSAGTHLVTRASISMPSIALVTHLPIHSCPDVCHAESSSSIAASKSPPQRRRASCACPRSKPSEISF
jgi:hypothetical protein